MSMIPRSRAGAARSRRRTSAPRTCRLDPWRRGRRPQARRRSRRSRSRALICQLHHGSVAIAAITSCTNTSNPSVMIGAGLLAKNAVERGLDVPALRQDEPGARLAGRDPLPEEAGLPAVSRGARLPRRRLRLHDLHRQLAVRCPTPSPRRSMTTSWWSPRCSPATATSRGASIPQVRASFLASPPLVVAYALAGTVDIDLNNDPLGYDPNGEPVFLRDIWPTPGGDPGDDRRVASTRRCSARNTATVFAGDERWQELPVPTGSLYEWDADSTYVQEPPFFIDLAPEPGPITAISGRARAGAARRFGHDRPHLAGRLDRQEQPGGRVPDRARRQAARLQLLRLPARQPRGDDPRHLRQHPPAQPAHAGQGRAT